MKIRRALTYLKGAFFGKKPDKVEETNVEECTNQVQEDISTLEERIARKTITAPSTIQALQEYETFMKQIAINPESEANHKKYAERMTRPKKQMTEEDIDKHIEETTFAIHDVNAYNEYETFMENVRSIEPDRTDDDFYYGPAKQLTEEEMENLEKSIKMDNNAPIDTSAVEYESFMMNQMAIDSELEE